MLTITVQGTLEDRLKKAAESSLDDPQSLAVRVLEQHLPHPNQSTLDLLAKWRAEEKTTDAGELAQREAEAEFFMRALAENRRQSEGPGARELLP
jgi:hypothetical protein